MIKNAPKILIFFITLMCASNIMACPQAFPTVSPGFCNSFKTAAVCHCTSSGLPLGMCSNMVQLYNRMIAMFGSMDKACQFQRDTSKQECIDDWNCYRLGGTNSNGELCSGTGSTC